MKKERKRGREDGKGGRRETEGKKIAQPIQQIGFVFSKTY